MDYGLVTIDMTSDKNFAKNGENLVISGCIDQSKGKSDIKEAKVILEERRMAASNSVNDWEDEQYVLGDIGSVGAGETKNFSVPIKIPESLSHHTALGATIGRYFLLVVRTELGCCVSPCPEASLHLVIQSTVPEIQAPLKVSPPANWAPVESGRITGTMKQYTSKPNHYFAHRNGQVGGE